MRKSATATISWSDAYITEFCCFFKLNTVFSRNNENVLSWGLTSPAPDMLSNFSSIICQLLMGRVNKKIEDQLGNVSIIGTIFLSFNDRFSPLLVKNRCLGTVVVLISPQQPGLFQCPGFQCAAGHTAIRIMTMTLNYAPNAHQMTPWDTHETLKETYNMFDIENLTKRGKRAEETLEGQL